MANLNPYLSFRDNAREAMEFYQGALGGELDISTFESFPDMVQGPDEASLVMHAQLTTPDGLVLMASDTPSAMPYAAPQGVAVSLSGPDADELRAAWDRLTDGASITMPFAPAPWGGLFGMFTDRFGIDWMVATTED
ncbi:VOC family protein [Microbacterium resistens]|uniref:VOC family protein n=1 Tax=Microbacterium resistens TaxID=156977 RepID=A0ABY3RQ87_9MICO|nr:VOC family protein [Microbacterium resistens]UGS25103.1 VOC family protein [Microbacterium resistens]